VLRTRNRRSAGTRFRTRVPAEDTRDPGCALLMCWARSTARSPHRHRRPGFTRDWVSTGRRDRLCDFRRWTSHLCRAQVVQTPAAALRRTSWPALPTSRDSPNGCWTITTGADPDRRLRKRCACRSATRIGCRRRSGGSGSYAVIGVWAYKSGCVCADNQRNNGIASRLRPLVVHRAARCLRNFGPTSLRQCRGRR
jgi:hypothetical protein